MRKLLLLLLLLLLVNNISAQVDFHFSGVIYGSMPSAPLSPIEGHVYYNATDEKFYYRNSSAWVEFGNNSGHFVPSTLLNDYSFDISLYPMLASNNTFVGINTFLDSVVMTELTVDEATVTGGLDVGGVVSTPRVSNLIAPSLGHHAVNLDYLNTTIGNITHPAEVNNLTANVVWANVPDVNITENSVTQHESALQITESQITDLQHITEADIVALGFRHGIAFNLSEDPDVTLKVFTLTNHVNAPNNGGVFWYIDTYFYSDNNATGNRYQVAKQYNGGNDMYIRSRFNSAWTGWSKVLTDLNTNLSPQTISKTGSTVTLSDGGGTFQDADTNTQLNESQVDAFVSNNGYITTEVDGSISNEIQEIDGFLMQGNSLRFNLTLDSQGSVFADLSQFMQGADDVINIPFNGLSATNVQGALNELQADHNTYTQDDVAYGPIALNGSTTSSGTVNYTIIRNKLIIVGSFVASVSGSQTILTLPIGSRVDRAREGEFLRNGADTSSRLFLYTNGIVSAILTSGTTYFIDAEVSLKLN